jgi:hypothetical protein
MPSISEYKSPYIFIRVFVILGMMVIVNTLEFSDTIVTWLLSLI